jgi:hypothetical protein
MTDIFCKIGADILVKKNPGRCHRKIRMERPGIIIIMAR